MCHHVIGSQGPPDLLAGRLRIPGRSPRPAPLIAFLCSHPTVSPPVGPNSCPLRPQGSSCVFFL